MEKRQLQRFCSQYLQLDNLSWPDAEYLRKESFQEEIYSRLFAEDGGAKYKPPGRYQLRVLKELTKRIEESVVNWDEEGISDNLMTQLSKLLFEPLPSEVASAQQKSFVTYSLSQLCLPASPSPETTTESPTISLLESRNLLFASGTTGLRTWEAALHLGTYLLSHPSLIRERSILELGAGTGYLSILCMKYLGAREFLATDGSEDIVSSLPTNIYLNDLEQSMTPEPLSQIRVKELKWGHPLLGAEEPAWNGGNEIDLVLGADVTYDASAHIPLVATFNELLDLYPKAEILIAATERNEKTMGLFFNTCDKAGLAMEPVEFGVMKRELQMGPFYDDKVPIRICFVRKKRSAP